ncbi:phage head closure protein [Pragia fontium]|uniref:phage head closure protein n=1 Tax=Pragia fontium TaxID=82985 RepID=UPI00064A2031|nr:hypothetical protein QQ39_05195 [Pragia fontium]
MRIGKLRHRVTLQRKEDVRDPVGQLLSQWGDVCTVWAEVHELSGRERISASAEQSETTALIKIRYRKGITTDMRIVHAEPTGSGEIYDILAAPADDRRTYIDLMCSSGVKK